MIENVKIETIEFNTAEDKLIVTTSEGNILEYTDKKLYIKDWPERVADCEAMGWR